MKIQPAFSNRYESHTALKSHPASSCKQVRKNTKQDGLGTHPAMLLSGMKFQ